MSTLKAAQASVWRWIYFKAFVRSWAAALRNFISEIEWRWNRACWVAEADVGDRRPCSLFASNCYKQILVRWRKTTHIGTKTAGHTGWRTKSLFAPVAAPAFLSGEAKGGQDIFRGQVYMVANNALSHTSLFQVPLPIPWSLFLFASYYSFPFHLSF